MKFNQLLFCLIGITQPLTGSAQEPVTWVTEHFEPYYINSGELANTGIVDRMNALMIKALPEYKHAIEYMPILRITASLKNKEHVVVNAYLKNPQDQKFAQYSITSVVVPPLELTIRKQDWLKKWQAVKSISIKQFLADGNLLAVAGRRYYGDTLMPLIFNGKEYRDGVLAMQSTHYMNLADMIMRNRVDGTIGYAAELRYHELLTHNTDALVNIPIEEDRNLLYGYIAMPQGAWGDAFKVKVDSALRQLRNTPEYKAILFDWFGRTPEFEAGVNARFKSDL